MSASNESLVSVPVRELTHMHIGCEVYIPRVNVMGVLSDFEGRTLYVGGSVVKVRRDERIVF